MTAVVDPFELHKHADHDQTSHGNWARGSDGGYKPKWRPSMTRDEAEAWARDSVYRKPLTHTSGHDKWDKIAWAERLQQNGREAAERYLDEHGLGRGIMHEGFQPSKEGVFGPGIYLGTEELEIVTEVPYGSATKIVDPEVVDVQAAEYAYGADRNMFPTKRVMVDIRNPLRVDIPAEDTNYAGGESILAALYPDGVDLAGGRWTPEMTIYEWGDMGGWDQPDRPFSMIDDLVRSHGYDSVIIEHEGTFEWNVGGDQVIVYDPKQVTVIEDDDYRYRKHYGPGPHPNGSPQTVHGRGGGGGDPHGFLPASWDTMTADQREAWAESERNPYRTGEIIGGDITSGDFRVEDDPRRRFTELWQRTFDGYDIVREAAWNVLEGQDPLLMHSINFGYSQTSWENGGYEHADLETDVASAGRWVADGLRAGEPRKRPLWRGAGLSEFQVEQMKVGDEVELGPSSTSSNKDVALGYAASNRAWAGTQYRVLYEFPKGTRSLNLNDHSDWSEDHPEHIVAGNFRIGSIERNEAAFGPAPVGASSPTKWLDTLVEYEQRPHYIVRLDPVSQPGDAVAKRRRGSWLDDIFHAQHRPIGEVVRKYSPTQPRDERGRWTSGAGGSSRELVNSTEARRRIMRALPNAHVVLDDSPPISKEAWGGIVHAIERMSAEFPSVAADVALVRTGPSINTTQGSGETVWTTVKPPSGGEKSGLGLLLNLDDFGHEDWEEARQYVAADGPNNTVTVESTGAMAEGVVVHEWGHMVHARALKVVTGADYFRDGWRTDAWGDEVATVERNDQLWAEQIGHVLLPWDDYPSPREAQYPGTPAEDWGPVIDAHRMPPFNTLSDYSRFTRAEAVAEAFSVRHGPEGTRGTVPSELDDVMDEIEAAAR